MADTTPKPTAPKPAGRPVFATALSMEDWVDFLRGKLFVPKPPEDKPK